MPIEFIIPPRGNYFVEVVAIDYRTSLFVTFKREMAFDFGIFLMCQGHFLSLATGTIVVPANDFRLLM